MYLHAMMVCVLLGGMAACGRQPASSESANRPANIGNSPLAAEEMRRFTELMLPSPSIVTEAGFTARVLLPPGHLYDPLFMILRGSSRVWVTDDGGRDVSGNGGQFVEADGNGKVTVLMGAAQIKPIVAADVAPDGFGEYGGQVFSIAEVQPADVIQRIDLTSKSAVDVCVLPIVPANPAPPAGGYEARFGPVGSPFAGKFFAITTSNDTVYQVTPDGRCTPFITFDGKRFSRPLGLAFTPDEKTMLVSGLVPGAPEGKRGAIVRVTPDGRMEEGLVIQGLGRTTGFARAPEDFGPYGGQWFVGDYGSLESPVPRGRPLSADGKIYRIAPDGKLHLVAQGFVNPEGLTFVNGKLWVCDIAGDFLGGREVPDGFIVEIQTQ